jgi:hypothetical protein
MAAREKEWPYEFILTKPVPPNISVTHEDTKCRARIYTAIRFLNKLCKSESTLER